jgi:hypothetical protein
MAARSVDIVVTNTVVSSYEARSYPHEQMDAKGFYNLYRVPVFEILVTGTDADGKKKSLEFRAPRFMPYFNDPTRPSHHYKAKGWLNAGLSSARRVTVSRYREDYAVQNRYSPGRGAIVVKDSFYIHAGPSSLSDVGFGSAGCIEIIGNYDTFKQSIADLSGLSPMPADAAIQQLVNSRKLIVTIQAATTPDIKTNFTRKFHD